MSSSNGLRIGLIAAIFLLITKGAVVRGQVPGPNAVVLMNNQTMLDCVVVQITASTWSRTTDGINDWLQIASGCSVSGINTAYYSTTQPGGNVCRLTIGNATMQQAGVYKCFDGLAALYSSLVTVIDPVANVVVYNQSEIIEDDHLNISCSINYTGPSSPAPSIRPSPYFTSQGQSFTSLTYYPSANIVTVVATVQVQKPKVPIFWCNTVFEITENKTGYNATPPADNITLGATTELDVQSVPPSTTPSVVSESTATITTTGSTTACTSGDNYDVAIAAAIAVGVILFISLALNIMQLIIMVKHMRTKHDPFKRAGTSRTILSPETLDLSNELPAPATYEELTRSNEIHLQPTYDKLTPKPPAPATYQELTHPNEIHLQPPTYEKLATKPSSYVDDLS